MQGAGLNIRRDSVVSQHRAAMMVSYFCTENSLVVRFFNLHHSLGKGSCRERSGSAPAVLNTSQQNVERRLLVLSVCSNTPFTKL